MKRVGIMIGICLLFLIIGSSCTKKDAQTEEITRILLQIKPVYTTEHDKGTTSILEKNGNVQIEKTILKKDDAILDKKEYQTTSKKFNELTEKITHSGLLQLNDELETDNQVMDGSVYILIITTTKNEYTFKGMNPKSEIFNECIDEISDYLNKTSQPY